LKKLGLLPRLIIAIIFGILIGSFAPEIIIAILATFNDIFGNFLGFAIPLIIIGFVAPGIGDLGEKAGKLLGITAGMAYGSTVLFGTITYFVASLVLPSFLDVGSINFNATDPGEALVGSLFTVEMPPVFGVMTALLLAFILGLGIAVIKGETLKKGIREFSEIINKLITVGIIPLLPIHIAGIFANMTYTGQVFTILSVFAKVFIMILILHWVTLLAQFSIAAAFTGENPLKMLGTMLPAYFTAIGTQSSAATIPVTVRQTYKIGVKKDIADFVVPLCATIHLSGSTITLLSCSMAIMMLNGQAVNFLGLFPFILMLGVVMVAAPGVPGGAVMAALAILESMLGFSQPMLSLMIALYIAQDSFGTACNVTGDAAIATIVNKISGNKLEPTI
jgi:Na+/H+-dicarboxylate symporter